MRTIFLAVVFVVTASLALAQKPNSDSILAHPCQEMFIPWGSDRNAVMKAATKAGLTFAELDQSEEQPNVFHLSYDDGSYRRMFSFAYNQYIGYTIIYQSADAALRNRIANKHLATFLTLADSIVSSKSVYVQCGEEKIRCNVTNNQAAVSVQILNNTVMTNAILRNVRRED